MVTIYIEDGSGRVYTGAPPITIGRGNECDLQLTDTEVSHEHLVIQQEGRDYVAEDQKSANGTFLRGPNHKISRAILCSGDSLILGQTRLRIEIDG
jgi:pSer/pThr/pTyr-binding forkhead associated (FHA) protein